MSEMTFEQAEAALDAAFDADGMNPETGNSPGDWQGSQTELPLDFANEGRPPGQTQQQAPSTPDVPDTPVAPEETQSAEQSFAERFDPNSLPPELLPAYKMMQADYTRKRQADAEAVRLHEQYAGVDLAAATELLQTVQNPEALLSFVQEASGWLADQGYAEFEDPQYEYDTETPSAPGTPGLAESLSSLVSEDPSMAPLAEAVQAMQARLDQFEQGSNQRLAAEREEQVMLQAMGELQRQENIIRGSFPTYTDEDIESIYEIASFHEGDLFAAQQSYEQAFARRLGRYVGDKGTPTPGVAPMGGVTAPGQVAELNYDPLNPKDAHKAALELLQQIESQPEA
jgi:hypothetical protein